MPLEQNDVPLNVYQAHLDQGRLAYQYSLDADRALFPPRLLCPFTGSQRLEWRVSRGQGSVYSLTVISPKDGTPYCVALVDMDEGFRLMSQIRPGASREPRIGDRVCLVTGKLSASGETVPLFDLEDASHA